MDEKELKRMIHLEFQVPDFPFLDTNNEQLVGYTSECKHSFQCGYLRALCNNDNCPSKFCLWGWYSGGLIPDQLCRWFKHNPKWSSRSTNYFINRKIMIERMIKNNETHEGKEIPANAMNLNNVGEYIFKPVNIFLLGADEEVTLDEIKAKWDWLGMGVGKPIYRIRYEEDIEKLKEPLRKQIAKVPNMGMTPNLVLKWKEDISDEYNNEVLKLIKDYESVQTVNIATRLVHSERIQENEFINAAYLNHSIWAYDLVDMFKGKTILCIAGGPSLKDNLKLIKENQDKFVIVAVSTVAELLFKEGIQPHIIGTIDMKSYNKLYLEALTEEQMKSTHLVFEIDTHRDVVDTYKGPKIMAVADIDRAPGTKVMLDYLPTNGFEFPKSGTVANMLYNFSRMLGPKEIILAGYDLCYIGEDTHIDGIRTGDRVKLINGDAGGKFFQFGDSKNVEEAIPIKLYAKDPEGNNATAWTTKAYYTYLVEIELRVRDSKMPTYEISERTALKELVNYKPLAEIIKDVEPLDINPHEMLMTVSPKRLRNNQVKHILRCPIKGEHKQDMRYNHVTRTVFMMKNYNTFPLLKYGTILQQLENIVVRDTKGAMEDLVKLSLAKWYKLNEEEQNGQ